MMIVLLIAGIGLLLAGLLTVAFGIQLDLSFGNTLILAGALVACTGVVLLGFWTVVRELKNIAQRLGPGLPRGARATPEAANTGRHSSPPESTATQEPAAQSSVPSPAPWHDETAARDRGPQDPVTEPAEAASAVKPKRNLLFSSSSRKERERAEARAADPLVAGPRPDSAVPPVPESREAPAATFDEAWPQPERPRTADAPLQRRSPRAPTIPAETSAGATVPDRYPAGPRNQEEPPVTVLKSGVVDGMAYSLYSDGSIEAQMPEGMMRFASIDELRSHLDQRP